MPVYVSTTYLGDGSDAKKAIQHLKSVGITKIEIGSNHSSCSQKEILRFFKTFGSEAQTRIDNRGIEFTAHNYFPAQDPNFVLNLASQSTSVREKSIKFMKNTIKLCQKLGIKFYTIHPGFFAEAMAEYNKRLNRNFDLIFKKSMVAKDRPKVISMTINIIENLYRFAIASGIQLLIENQGSQTSNEFVLFDSIEELELLKKGVGEHLKFNFNLAHATLTGIDLYDPLLFKYCHQNSPFFEASETRGIYDSHLPLQPGNGRVLKLLKNYKDLLKKRNVILEYRNIGQEKLLESFEFVNKILA